jgi:hypothetical protein
MASGWRSLSTSQQQSLALRQQAVGHLLHHRSIVAHNSQKQLQSLQQ